MATLQLGKFKLLSRIGEGSAGQVWRGLYGGGQVVAIKVLTSAMAARSRARQAFRHEAHLLAGLDHPHVVRLLDFGVVTEAEAAASGGALAADAPYLAMEYARGGTLVPWCGAMDWRALRLALAALLDALAHAHARGVIHRDIKPENVLLTDAGDPASSLRLADFGIARLRDDLGLHERGVAGTPLYVAPEQQGDDPRAQGAWTDLYSLGRLALALAGYTLTPEGFTGAPRRPLPEGFLAWAEGLTRPAPFARVASAADARAGLMSLDEGGPPDIQATLPATWREAAADLRPRPPGLGLSLLGMRRPPLTGRGDLRDRLWAALTEVHSSQRPLWVALSGSPGVGRRALAEWLSQRAYELGGLRALRVEAGGRLDDVEALVAALRGALGAEGLGLTACAAQLRRALRPGPGAPLDAETLHAMAQALQPLGVGGPELESAERLAVLRGVLRAMAGGRALLLTLPDLHEAPGLRAFVDRALAAPPGLPLLVLSPTRTDPLPGERARTLAVLPLTLEEQAGLLREGLGLEDHLAASLAQRTEGNPLFAIQLVSAWAADGRLVATPAGHVAAPGQAGDAAASLGEVWSQRLERMLAAHGPDAALSMELAAVMGATVDAGEWRRACAVAGVSPALALLEDMLEAGLVRAEAEGEGWTCSHGLLCDALRQRAREGGRWTRWNRAVVAALMGGFTGHNLAHHHAERVGRHLLAAGAPAEALPHLARSLERRIQTGDHARAELLFEELDEAMRALEGHPDDSRWGEREVLAARLDKARGRRDRARAAFTRALEMAEGHGWPRVKAQALQGLGDLAWLSGDAEEAQRRHQDAVALALDPGDPALATPSRLALGALSRRRGDLLQATRWFEEAAEGARATGDRVGEGYALRGLGECSRALGQLPRARALLEEALASHRQAGALRGVADTLNSLGELARQEGRPDEAVALYTAARDRLRLIGSPMALAPETNLALVLLDEGRFAEARQVLLGVLASLDRGEGPRVFKGNVHAYLLPAFAALRDWSGFERHLVAARVLLGESGEVEEDVARLAELGGDLAAECGRGELAREARSLALAQRQGLGDGEAAARLQRRLAADA